MKYYVSFHQNFIDVRTFVTNARSTNTSITLLDFQKGPVHPFMFEGMLHYPLTLNIGTGPGVIGFLRAKVNDNGSIQPDKLHWLDSEEKIKQTGIKLSPQSIKTLKTVSPNKTVFSDMSSWTSRGFKCKSEDVIKSLVLGYYTVPESRDLMESLCYSDYSISSWIKDKRNSNTDVAKKLVNWFETDVKSHWSNQNTGTRLAQFITRTAKAVDESYVVKWRKPNKSSKWPYTLDHHWFVSQESPIATAHHSLNALMGKSIKKDQLMLNLPIFTNIRQLEVARKILEHFYGNLSEVLKPNSSKFGTYISMVQDFDWPNGRYSSRKLTPDTFPVKVCLALGVTPVFDNSGHFVKFAPIANTLQENKTAVYIDMDVDILGQRKPEISLLLGYAVGMLDLSTLEKLLGPISASFERLQNDPDKVQLQISPNVVCCLPMTSARANLDAALVKYGVYLRNQPTGIDVDDITADTIVDHLNEVVTL